MPRDDVLHFAGLESDVPRPLPEASSRIDCFDPFVQGVALGAVLGAVGPLDLERQDRVAGQADKEIRGVAASGSRPHVIDLEPEVVVLGVGLDLIAGFEDVRRMALP